MAAHIMQDSFGISRTQPRRCRRFSTFPAGRQNLLCCWLPVPRLGHSVVSPQSSQPRSEPRIGPRALRMSQARPNKGAAPNRPCAFRSESLFISIAPFALHHRCRAVGELGRWSAGRTPSGSSSIGLRSSARRSGQTRRSCSNGTHRHSGVDTSRSVCGLCVSSDLVAALRHGD